MARRQEKLSNSPTRRCYIFQILSAAFKESFTLQMLMFLSYIKEFLIHDIPESNEANRVHQIRSELLSSLSTKMKFFEVGSQHRTREEKAWVLACEGGNYGGQQEDTKMSLPFFIHTRITECNSANPRFEGLLEGNCHL